MPQKSLRFARRRIRAAVLRGRYEYPLGVADRSQFASRLTYWNYAALLRTEWREDLGLQALAERFQIASTDPGKTDTQNPVVSIGSGQKWEIKELGERFGSVTPVTHIALSPFLVWTSAVHHNQWANTLYVPGTMADRFLLPGHNWIFLKTLEMVENPAAWIATAVEQAEQWVYFLLDLALPRRLQDIDRLLLCEQFPVGEWEMFLIPPRQNSPTEKTQDGQICRTTATEILPRSAVPTEVYLSARKIGVLFIRGAPPATSNSSENAS